MRIQIISYLQLDRSGSFKLESDSVAGLIIYDFPLVLNANICLTLLI